MATVGRVHTSALDDYVRACDEQCGGIHNPAWASYVSDFELVFDTPVDVGLDPCSPEYLAQQLALHQEITGRSLDQGSNEPVPLPVDANALSVNPYNDNQIKPISGHAATVAMALRIAALPDGARVLDLGVGVGMSSEMMAYCGAKVDAVDINPMSVDLIGRRARRLNMDVTPHLGNFDSFEAPPGTYDAAFFFASLHHGVKPWEFLGKISKFLKPDGKIVFSGEPIQQFWWPDWGLRLDPESIYVSRKYGWFESGWSDLFLRRIFRDIGMHLELYPVEPRGIIEGSEVGVATLEVFPVEITQPTYVDFSSTGDGSPYAVRGWGITEPWGRWSSGRQSDLLFSLEGGAIWKLTIEVFPLVSEVWPRQIVEVLVGGREVGSYVLDMVDGSATMEATSTFAFEIDARHQTGRSVVTFRFPSAVKPSEIGRGEDHRLLAIGLVSATIEKV